MEIIESRIRGYVSLIGRRIKYLLDEQLLTTSLLSRHVSLGLLVVSRNNVEHSTRNTPFFLDIDRILNI